MAVELWCFARHGSSIMLCRSPAGQWTVPTVRETGDAKPLERARTALSERFGLTVVEGIRSGRPIERDDAPDRTVGVLVEVADRSTEPAVSDRVEWASPPAILDQETPSGLWTVYASIAPTIRSIAADTQHGSSYLSLRALEILRDRAAVCAATDVDGDELAALGRELRSARPDMIALKVRVARTLTAGTDPGQVQHRAAEAISDARRAVDQAAAAAAAVVPGDAVIGTISRSGTVERAIEAIDPRRVVVARSRPGDEGVALAESLAADRSVTLAPDAAIGSTVSAVDAVVVGADGIAPDGTVVNKLGTRTLVAAAAHHDVATYVVATTAKCGPVEALTEHVPVGQIYDGDAPLSVSTDRFDRTPGDWFDGYCTERGRLDRAAIGDVATRHAAVLAPEDG